MRDDDRADKLARAIEEMVQGGTPADLEDEELQDLLKIAKIRLDAAQMASQAGTEAQGSVLDRLMARLDSLQGVDRGDPGAADDADRVDDITSDHGHPERSEVTELQEIIGLRRQIAEHAAAVSETHREAVWQRVQTRIQTGQSSRRGFFRWPFRHHDREADDFGAALDRMILGEPIWEAEGSRLEELLRVARIRRAAAVTTSAAFADQHARVWARIRPRLMARQMLGGRARVFKNRAAVPWPKLAAAGAGLAIVIAALGPLPATGFADHPLAEATRFLGINVGVTETSTPPTIPPVTEIIESSSVPADEASSLLGLPVYEPTSVPDGYHQVSSQYFPEPLTGDEGGLFVLIYERAGTADNPETVIVYQERASPNSIAVQDGFAQTIWLPAGVPATYVVGSWQPFGTDLTWGKDSAQTLLFDFNGLRTIIHARDARLPIVDLVILGNSLAAQSTPPN